MTLNRFGGIGTGRRSWAAPAAPSRRIPAMMASGRRATDIRSRIVAPRWRLDDVGEWRPLYHRRANGLAWVIAEHIRLNKCPTSRNLAAISCEVVLALCCVRCGDGSTT